MNAMPTAAPRPRRSLIFAPGNRPDMFPKAAATGADMVCIDLEDAIAPGDKTLARERTLALFAGPAPDADVEVLVRINALSTPEGLADVLALRDLGTPPPALMIPKAAAAAEIRLLAELLSTPATGAIRFHVIIETNAALEAAADMARASDRIDSLLFGGVDLAAELRSATDWTSLLYARSRVVHAAAGAGLDVLDVPWLDLADLAGLAAEAAACRALGFTGKAAIHPRQIAPINAAFSPAETEIAWARQVNAAFAASESGLVVVDGKLIERPVLRSVARTLAIAERLAAAGSGSRP